MATEEPPPYEEAIINNNESIEAAPPPAAFGQAPPNIQYPVIQPVQQPIAKNSGGEVYKPIASQSSPPANAVGGGGENSGANVVRVVYIQPQNQYPAHGVYQPQAANYNRYEQPPSNTPCDLFHFTIRDHRINAFGGNGQCVCCCHLLMAAYICLVIFIIYHCFAIGNHLIAKQWGWVGYPQYDVILAIYSAINIIINVICYLGINNCKSQYIRPQIWMLLSFILVLICNLILRITIEEISLFEVFGLILTVCVILWLSWIFNRIYGWAYYYQHGGQYVANAFKPPSKLQMVQPQQIQMQPIQPIPQDGNL